MFSPVHAVGGLTRRGAFLGSCFAFRRPDTFLTAKHCVLGQGNDLHIVKGSVTEQCVLRVTEVVSHERVDLAVLRTDGTRVYVPQERYDEFALELPREEREAACFIDDISREQSMLGVHYGSYGFASDMPTQHDRGGLGEPRVFRGYVHRRMIFSGGYGTYRALELSDGVPGGASGSPLFVPDNRRVLGLATTTVESRIPGERVDETDAGTLRVTSSQPMMWRVGVAVDLSFYRAWLDMVIPSDIATAAPTPGEGQ